MGQVRGVRRLSFGDLAVRSAALGYLGLMVVVPILALFALAFEGGLAAFWKEVTRREALSAMTLTVEMSILATAITVAAGLWIAWTLKRREFIGKGALEAIIDLPLAIPATVAGLVLLSLYGPKGFLGTLLGSHGIEVVFAKPGILLALLFVTLPLMVRTLQPAMDELEPDVELASFTLGATRLGTFRRITLPALFPALAAGASLTVARALGEFGSLVLIAGNIPFRTEVAPTYLYARIESSEPAAASAVAVVLLLASVSMLLAIEYLQVRARRTRRQAKK